MLPFNIGPTELLVILGVGVLLFGKRLPELGGQLARGIVEFRRNLRSVEEDVTS